MKTVNLLMDNRGRTIGVFLTRFNAIEEARNLTSMFKTEEQKFPGGFQILVNKKIRYKIREVRVK